MSYGENSGAEINDLDFFNGLPQKKKKKIWTISPPFQLVTWKKICTHFFKGVRVWIIRHLSSPRPYFQAEYWIVDVDDDNNDHL